jgi:hypothetical protein
MTSSINDNLTGQTPACTEAELKAELYGTLVQAGDESSPTNKSLADDESGATTLEFALLLACIAFPAYFILQAALGMLIDYYRMTMTLLALPLP